MATDPEAIRQAEQRRQQEQAATAALFLLLLRQRRYDLAALIRQAFPRLRRRTIQLRPIVPPSVMASDLYQSVYRPIVDIWVAAGPKVAAGYEAGVLAGTSATALEAVAAAEAEATAAMASGGSAARRWATRTEEWQRGRFAAAVKDAAKVDVSMMMAADEVAQTVEQAIAWNVELVRDVSAETRRRITQAVLSGVNGRTPAREVAAAIDTATGLGRKRALRIASHQLTSITSKLSRDRREQAGLSAYRYRHSGKLHPRQAHLVRNGNLYSSDPALVGKIVEGKTIRPDIAPSDRAGIPPFCGCREEGLLILD